MLNDPLTSVKGIGPKRAELFSQLGIVCVRDLFFRLPRDYLDYSKATPVCELVRRPARGCSGARQAALFGFFARRA